MKTTKHFVLTICTLVHFVSLTFSQEKVQIHHIDVGAGDATLINILQNGGGIQYSILIDAGETDQEETVINYLRNNAKTYNGRVYLDYVISSHYHSDHIGGMVGMKAPVYESGSVGKKRKICGYAYTGVLGDTANVRTFAILDKGDVAPVPSSRTPRGNSTLFSKYKTLAGDRRVTVGATVGVTTTITPPAPAFPPTLPNANQALSLGGYINLGQDLNGIPIRLRLILTNANVYYPGQPNDTYNVADTLGNLWGVNLKNRRQNENNWGLGWVLEYGAFRYYTAGDVGGYNNSYNTCLSCGSSYFDIETPMSQAFAALYTQPANAHGHICAQKASHHGSCCSSNPAFLNTLKSNTCIFSCGTMYEHPTQEVIDRIEALNWNVDSLNNHTTTRYLMTELFYHNRNINLVRGSTSGSAMLVATNLPYDPAAVETSYLMLNGGHLLLFRAPDSSGLPSAPITPGNIVLKIAPTNNGFPISQRSYYTIQYLLYDGTVRQEPVYCHGQ